MSEKAKIAGETIVRFGKHKGKTIEKIYSEDQNYLVWFMMTFKQGNDEIGKIRELIKDFMR